MKTLPSPPSTPLRTVQNLQNILPFPKMKPILGKRVTFQSQIPSNLITITKYRPKILSTVQLANLESNKPNFSTVRTICKALKDAKKGSTLIVRKDDESDSQNLKQLKYLFNNSHHRWKKLFLHYISPHHSLDKEGAGIITKVRKYQDLSYLEVVLCCTKDMKNRLLPRLLQQSKGLKNLRAFDLDLSKCANYFHWIGENPEPNTPIFTFRFPRSLKSIHLSFQRSSSQIPKLLDLFALNISRCNSLKYLTLDCLQLPYDFKPSILARIFEKKQSIKYLRITKEFYNWNVSQTFIQDFKYLKHLIALDLEIFFHFQEEFSKISITSLFKQLASLQNLNSLQLRLHVQRFSSDPDYQNFFVYLQSLTRLKKLILLLYGHANQSNTHLQYLPQALQPLSCLITFKLFLPDHKVSHTDITSLSQMLKESACLENLALLFGDVDLKSDCLEILFKSVAHLNLSSFIFNIMQQKKTSFWDDDEKMIAPLFWENDSECPLFFSKDDTEFASNFSKDEKKLTSLFSTLSAFTSLSTLNLDFSVFEISTKQLKDLSLALREMEQLSNFYLQLPGLDSFQGLKSLLSSLKEIPKLVSFQLVCKGEKLCDEEVELTASSLSEFPKSLETLELNFRKTRRLGNKSLLALQNGLRNLFSLKSLTLVLGKENIFCKKIAFELFETLSFLKNLETIKVEFPSEIVPLDFESLLSKMGGHSNLKIFTVNRKSCFRKRNQDRHEFFGLLNYLYLFGDIVEE